MTSILTRGNEVRVNTYTTYGQFTPSVTTLSDGRYVITWSSDFQDGSGDGVYMQMYDASGAKIGIETRVNTTSFSYQSNPETIALEGGGFVVAWQSWLQDGSTYGAYFQVYDENGNTVGGETLINTTTANAQTLPTLSALQGGGFVATWSSYNQDAASGYGIYARVFTDGGFAFGSEFAVNTTTAFDQYKSQVATLSDGSFVVIWESYNQDGSYDGIYMRRFDVDGAPLTAEILVNTTTDNSQQSGDIIALANGGFLISWYGYGSQANNTDTQGVFYQLFDSNNNKVGTETLVNTYTDDGQISPSMTALSDGGFVCVWSSHNQDRASYGVYGQRFDENGAKIGGEFQINGYIVSDQLSVSVSALNDGGFVVAWQSDIQDGSGYGIYSRRYGAATNLSGTQYLYGTFDGDRLDGGIGGDYMYGGQGNDTYVVNASSDVVSENANQGLDLVETSVTLNLDGTNVENATLLGVGDLNISGSALNNYIIGNAGRNTLTGDDGDDTLLGGAGIDFIFGGNGYDVLYGGDGNDRLYSDALEDALFGEGGNDELNGGLGNDSVYGGDGEDYIFGEDGDDLIDGGLGHDTLVGGAGEDAIQGGDGNDFIYGFGDNDIIYGGIGQDTILDGLGDDTVYAGDHDDTVYAGSGRDHFNGEGGIDTLNASELSVGVYANLATGQLRVSGVVSFLSGFENLAGSAYNDKLYGDTGNNVIDGNGGADTMAGGAGNDVYYYDNEGDTVTETDGQGDDLLFSSVNVALGNRSIETVILTGEINLSFTSGSQATEVWGNGGSNNINAGLGADTIYGGLGNDTIYVDDVGDLVIEYADEGTDRISSSISYTLGNNVENLTLTGTANINGTGNSLANSIVGNNGNNRIDGGSGSASDSLRGGLGDDTYIFNLGFGIDDITNETGGTDTILFGAGITAGMIIMQDVGADRYYAIDDGVHLASACANRIKIAGGAGGAIIETIAYTPPAAPALSPAASSAQLTQALAVLPLSGASESLNLTQNAAAPRQALCASSLLQVQRFAA